MEGLLTAADQYDFRFMVINVVDDLGRYEELVLTILDTLMPIPVD